MGHNRAQIRQGGGFILVRRTRSWSRSCGRAEGVQGGFLFISNLDGPQKLDKSRCIDVAGLIPRTAAPQIEAVPMNQISQSTEFKALRNPPNALSRQGSVLPAAFRRSEIAVRLIAVVFGFDLGRATVVTFFDLRSR
jgi:hypothetical protein